MTERVTIEHVGSIAHVRLNRPEKKNGLDLEMFEAIIAAGVALTDHAGLRAVVLSGEGGCFCAGLDFMAFMAGGEEAQERLLNPRVGGANPAQRIATVWQEVPVPVIAAIEGVAFGGGCQLAAGADLRIAAPDARLSVMEIKWGLIPDMGITQTLMRLVRPDVLKELTWTGRVVEADEALAIGLITSIATDPVAAALALAETIASKNPQAQRASKAMFRAAHSLGPEAALTLETELQLPLLGSANQLEAVMANMQKRAARFED
ncbi:MAG: crotonase/enoyl-CoA hydratase family protein [Deltaproteobacteria bacterium]|nr:crotonase/enoyl-CoA hydratase family protein [Deltaproteobacteria bacterium]